MSRFSQDKANQIVFRSFRNRKKWSKKPLDGKQVLLLEALLRAEHAHDTELDRRTREFQLFQNDIRMFKEHEEFYKHFKVAMQYWRLMEEPFKKRLVDFIQNHLQTIEGTIKPMPLNRLRKRCDDTLEAIALAAHEDVKLSKGRRSGVSQSVGDANKSLRPLLAFAKELKSFWIGNANPNRFGQQFDGENPISAPAKMLIESSKFLKVKYTPANIQSVMKMLTRKKPKQLGDEFLISFPRVPGF